MILCFGLAPTARSIAWTRFILPWSPPGQVAPLDELHVVHHPEAAEVVLVAHEALVQGQVGADGILQVPQGKKGKKKAKLIIYRVS